GCHAHVSIWGSSGTLQGTNLFHDPAGELGVSEMGYHFLGGILRHGAALSAISNPTVNSYKRINAPRTTSGATWSPNTLTYGGNNRTHMIRIPDEGRFELRLADGAANPYLYPAAILAAGMDGVANKRDPGKRLDIDMYAEGHKVRGARKLPLNLLDALRELEKNKVLRAALGEETVAGFLKLKTEEWNEYTRHLTQWERDTTLDC
ncbi:MAG: type III glutamate--ammonia ligase, partial [Pseudomonadota bacterium]